MGILTMKKMYVPPLWLVRCGWGGQCREGEVILGLFKLKGWCVLQDLVLDVW